MVESGQAPRDPRTEYTFRLDARRADEARWRRRELAVSNARLAIFVVAVVVAWLAVGPDWFSIGWLVVPVVAFGGLMVFHEHAIRTRRRACRAAAFYAAGLARLEGRWQGSGESGARFLDPPHPYARDLDLFGEGSVFELLCAARTRMGENTLAAWLRAPAPAATIRARQGAVGELKDRLDLREDLAVLGEEVQAGVDPVALTSWSVAPPVLVVPGLQYAAGASSVASAVALLGWALWGFGAWPFLAAMSIQGALALVWRSRVRAVVDAVERPGRDLELLSLVLARLERERFTSPLLRDLRSALDTEGVAPSRAVALLARLIDLLNSRRNQIFAPFGALALWGTQCARAIESWRVRFGHSVPGWLSAVGELEALASLAGQAYEHPYDTFPEISGDGPVLHGEGLGHPLLPEDRSVANDIRLDGDLGLLVVSGSNMSGKSTLLRTVGVNVVLAQAGASVRSARMRISPLAVGATLRIQDSLREGSSRFYAEITRLRQLMEIAEGPLPLLFLLDEILHGTNSHDRRIGAEAVVRGLMARDAIGLVTTHDLALSRIADELAPRAANVHFEDRLEAGRIHFDYRLRSGVVRKSNALELMRSVGLEV